MTPRTVLIVDDSLTVRMDLADAFAAAGLRTVLCATAAEARSAFAGGQPDLIVLDVLLPDGDGVELLTEIRAMPALATTPVVMLSTEAEIKDRIRGLTTGADEYVGKPYDIDYLVTKVDALIRARAGADACTLLLIDDSPTFRAVVRDALEGHGYAVLEAASGEEGLRIAGARRPDGIVVDGMLPGIDGPTVIRHVRLDAALRDVPCLLLTGSEGKHAELRALDAGADAFVRKEEAIDVILARVAAMLRRSPVRAPATGGIQSLSGPKRILAVDDSPTYLHGLADALKGEGYEVILAPSGEEALELLAVQQVDCILLDLMMPGLTGQETCARIKAAPAVREIPLIMLTALEDRDAMIQGLSAGADDYISKSSDMAVLKARVRAQIRRKQFEDENRRVREELLDKEFEASEARAASELAQTKLVLVEELERKNRELEAFSYSVSHDLRAPLRAIDGFSRILVEHCGDAIDAKGRDYLSRIRTSATRMGELIDDLLELSRVGRAEIRREAVNLSALTRDVADILNSRAERPVDVHIGDHIMADADPRLVRIVLENLLANCWKFTARTARPEVRFEQLAHGAETVFAVRDNGAGFDNAHAGKLFRAFQRLHSESEYAGTGIGLATVQRILERHGGRIWAEGAVGTGAAFYFTLGPARTESPARAMPALERG